MEVTLYIRPNGRKEVTKITNILPEDEQWFAEHNVKISMEDIGVCFALYADIGRIVEGEPAELVYLTRPGDSCESAMSALRNMCEQSSK